MTEFKFEFDENAKEYFEYYLLGERPVRLTIFNEAPVLAETVDLDSKKLIIDNMLIIRFLESTDAQEISKDDFVNQCLSFGVTPVREK
mgnify:CR=1 FL=1|tara:strand:- start:148 stop:411 length:264 start_codon:yes stop_codon:yes gene_type:complete